MSDSEKVRASNPHRRPQIRRRLAFNGFFAGLHHHRPTRPDTGLDQWWGPQHCAKLGGGQVTPDAHGQWRSHGRTVPFWLYSNYVRTPMRTLVATVQQHVSVRRVTAEQDAIWWPINPSIDAHPGSRARAERLHQLDWPGSLRTIGGRT